MTQGAPIDPQASFEAELEKALEELKKELHKKDLHLNYLKLYGDILVAHQDSVRAIIGEDETLEPESEWYAKTKAYGGTHEEYWRLKAIFNNNKNLRAEQRLRAGLKEEV